MRQNTLETADLVTLTEKIFNGIFVFCAVFVLVFVQYT